MKEVEPDFHREWEMSSHPRYLRPWWETQRLTTSSLVGPSSNSESFFTAPKRFCRWSSGTHGAGDAENCLVGEGSCQEGQGPLVGEGSIGRDGDPVEPSTGTHTVLRALNATWLLTLSITVHFTICELFFNSQCPLTPSVILRAFFTIIMWPHTNLPFP